jgi:hypothetical protein
LRSGMDLGLCAVAATQTRRRTAKPRWCSHERQHNRAVAVAPDRAVQRQGTAGRVSIQQLREAHAALADCGARQHAIGMFVVTEADAAAIRAVFTQEGELSAAIELRRRFPGITDNAKARTYARTIAGWKPLPPPPCSIIQLRRRSARARLTSHSPPATETPATDPAK